MSLKLKASLFVMGALTLFALANYFVLEELIYPRFLEYEKAIAIMSVDQIADMMMNEAGHVDNMCADWANWDASCDFVKSHDPEFINSNLGAAAFRTTKLNLFIYLDNQYKVVFEKAYDFIIQEEIRIDDLGPDMWNGQHFLIPRITDQEDLTQNYIIGMINTSRGVLIVSSRLILDNEGQGPPCGVLIIGKFLKLVSPRIAQQSRVDFEIIRDLRSLAFREEIERKNYIVQIGDADFTYIYKAIRDVKGEMIFVLKCKVPRKFYARFIGTLKYFLLSFIIFTVLLFFVLLLMQNMIIFKHLTGLKKHMRLVRQSGDYSGRIPVRRLDEIGSLADSFNSLCETIEENKARLEAQALTDQLTGLFNRWYLNDILKREISRARRTGQASAVIMLDIDKFKLINDEHGHKGGDHVLVNLAEMLRMNSRQADVLVRYGGEEFLIFMPDLPLDKVLEAAERLRKLVEYSNFFYRKVRIPVTISLGCAVFPDHGEDPDTLIKSADDALYRAKNGGRNRVECAI